MSEDHATIKEIWEQPEAIKNTLQEMKEGDLSELFYNSSEFCLTGCGSSYFLALSGNSLLNESKISYAFPGSEVFVSSKQLPNTKIDIIIPISRSGESTETVQATKFLKSKYPNSITTGITCTENSQLYKKSDIPIIARKGKEDSVVMTKSYSSMLIALEYLAKTSSSEVTNLDPKKLAEGSKKVLNRSQKIAKEIGSRDDLEKFVFLGSGELYGLASEAMLKMEEMTLSWSKVYHPLEFRHGPKSIADEGTLVTIFLPNRKFDIFSDLLEDIEELGSEILAIGDEEPLSKLKANYQVRIPNTEHRSLSFYMPVVQLIGYYRAISNGLNPDNPKNLTQVVKIS